ncbi:MAG: endonuclease V [Candidatus Methanofastidiosia archaeon]
MDLEMIEDIQRHFSNYVKEQDDFKSSRYFCGVDVAYKEDNAVACAVVTDYNLNLVDNISTSLKVKHKYIPGFFAMREFEAIEKTISKLSFDILFVNGHGISHPRGFGLACQVGVFLDIPVIGIARKRLCGTFKANDLYYGERLVARKMENSKIIVSVGNRISLESAVAFARHLGTENVFPLPLRLADLFSREKIDIL